MPCVYDDYGASERQQREDLDTLTRLLCHCCSSFESIDDEIPTPLSSRDEISKELQTWWNKHKVFDAKRRQEERHKAEMDAKRKNARAKLTREERELLGI